MHGLEQIKAANENPAKYAKSQMSDGQARRNDSPPSNYWSETPGGDRFADPGPNMATMQVSPKLLPQTIPSIYFDAAKLATALDERAAEHLALSARIKGSQAMVRMAKTNEASREAIAALGSAVQAALHSNDGEALKLHMLVNDMANTIDVIAPPNPKGYVPHMGIHYAVSPLRKILNSIREAIRV